MAEIYVLGKRRFFSAPVCTIQHSFFTAGLLRRSGLDRLQVEPGEAAEDFATRIVLETLAGGEALQLLGCLLLPEGIEPSSWRPELAQETAEFIGGLTAEEDHALVRSILIQALLSFFESGLVSLWTSRISSEKGEPGNQGQETPSPGESGPS